MAGKRLLMTVGGAALAFAAQCASGNASQAILGVVLESGNPGQILSEGNTTLETASVDCNIRGIGCNISMRIMSSVGNAACQHEWAIVGLVDGNSVDGGPSQGSLPPSSITNTGMWQGGIDVGYGTHTLAFQLYVPCAATANQWSVRYTVSPWQPARDDAAPVARTGAPARRGG